MFQEDDEIEEEIIQQDYRDRAEERRKGFNQEIKQGEFVELEGFEKEVKLKGLDFTLIEEPKKTIDKASIIAKIKKDLTAVKENQPKKTIHPMAIKIEAFLQKKQEIPKNMVNAMNYVYKYDTDPNYGISMPQFFTKKKQDDGEGLVNVQLKEEVLKMLEDSRLQTKDFSIKRFGERHKFDQQTVIPTLIDDEDSENIFDDVKNDIKKPNVDVKQLLDVEKDEVQFDIKDYINNNLFDQKNYNQLKQEVERDQKEKEEKLKKHKKMLEGEDYYFECYQAVGLTIAEEKEHKEELEQKKMVNPEFKEFDFIKQDFKKKKRKRVNLQNQLDQIEDILQKKTK